ncbi:hypothetical protein D3C71_1375530 [compost metagenome]
MFQLHVEVLFIMAGGYKKFGPTYNSTPYVRLGYEGILNGSHNIDPAIVAAAPADGTGAAGELAGKFAAIGANGVKLAGDGGADAVGLFREDLGDMVNASLKATFYFRGGEYYVALSRAGSGADTLVAGDEVTSDATGKIVKYVAGAGKKALGRVTHVGAYTAGNMYANAGTAANGGVFVGFILYI